MRKIRAIIAFIIIFTMVMNVTSAMATTIYKPNGATRDVAYSEVEKYKAEGWYETYEEVTTKIYAPDGRQIVVYNDDVKAYLNLGWFKTYEEVTTKIYAPDGRQIVVYNDDVKAYLDLGWFKTYEEVTTKLYAPDGREIVVYNSQVDSFVSVGWFTDRSDFVTKMVSSDGSVIEVYDVEVQNYINNGWTPIQKNKIDPSKPMVALTFDDGPNGIYTPRILNVLEKYNAKATFFVLGNLVPGNRDIVARAVNGGNQVGNHSYSHPQLTTLGYGGVQNQIQLTSNEIYQSAGVYPTAVRPPYGSYNSTVASAAGMPLILWSIDTLDWQYRNADRVVSHILSNVRDGDIVLMHDIYASTASAAERVIPELLRRGYQLVTVDQLSMYKEKPMSAGGSYSCFR